MFAESVAARGLAPQPRPQPHLGRARDRRDERARHLRRRRHRPGKLKLILCGFSEAALAVHAIHPLVFPGQALHFEYSTTTGVPAI